MISRFLGKVETVDTATWNITFSCKLFEGFDTFPTAKRMFNTTREVLVGDRVTVFYNDESQDGFIYAQNFVDGFVGLKMDRVTLDITSGETYDLNINDSTKIHVEDGTVSIDIKSKMKIEATDSKAELSIDQTKVTVEGSAITFKSPQIKLDGTSGSVSPNASFTGGLCAMPVCAYTGAPHCGNMIVLS